MEDKMYSQWKEKKISREEENEMPSFASHDEARAYFKERFGDDFQMTPSRGTPWFSGTPSSEPFLPS